MKVGIILTPDERSKAYLQKILRTNISLDEIIFMNDQREESIIHNEAIKKSKESGFDISIAVSKTLIDNKIICKEFDFVNINNSQLVDYLSKSGTDIFIFTGGGILKNDILNSGPKFLHLHPGIVPNYRGSTCFYYSIINDDVCGVTAYFMNEKIDTGDIIYQKNFSKPDHKFIDDVYDAHIRSETLLHVLKNKLLSNNKITKQDSNEGETYFIIHPVLKHIGILSCI